MFDSEHLKIVKDGTEAIKLWRKKNPKVKFSLSGANLYKSNFSDADLSDADFFATNLIIANFSRANLTGAELSSANLTGANLIGANLIGANLIGANLFGAELYGVNLSGANLSSANLSGANLSGANLSGADLTGVNLTGVNLSGANLTGADLKFTIFYGTVTTGTKFFEASMQSTIFNACNLSKLIDIESIKHIGPSSIGIDTVENSFRGSDETFSPELESFFIDTGISKNILFKMKKVFTEVKYYTCFVSYGQPDIKIAEKLHKDLKSKGISSWLYKMDKTIGKKIWHEIGEKMRKAEKIIVLCSDKSLTRDGVLKEIEETIDEEPNKMIPISLDNTWREKGFRIIRGDRDLKPYLDERNYADFSKKSKYKEAFENLLNALKRPS